MTINIIQVKGEMDYPFLSSNLMRIPPPVVFLVVKSLAEVYYVGQRIDAMRTRMVQARVEIESNLSRQEAYTFYRRCKIWMRDIREEPSVILIVTRLRVCLIFFLMGFERYISGRILSSTIRRVL
jgi:hypothetical protein